MRNFIQFIMVLCGIVVFISLFNELSQGCTSDNLYEDGYGGLGSKYAKEASSWHVIGATAMTIGVICYFVQEKK